MANPSTTEAIEGLAAEIGQNIYMDIAKWHLYLSDAHLAWAIAEKVYPMLQNNALEENKIVQILEDIPVTLGGGKRTVSLIDLLPTSCQANLMDLLEEYQRNL
jgi:hypothetical protein